MSAADEMVADLAERVARLEVRGPRPLQTVLDSTLEPPEDLAAPSEASAP